VPSQFGLTGARRSACNKLVPWSRKLSSPIILTDGRKLETLNQVREAMLSISVDKRHEILWRRIAALLDAAASGNLTVAELQEMLLRGLRDAGLL
jgi:hypothetical protein